MWITPHFLRCYNKDMNQQLVDYIKQQLQAGVSKENVKSALLGAGWSEADISEALKSADAAAPAVSSAVAVSSSLTSGPAAQSSSPKNAMVSDVASPQAKPASISEPAAGAESFEAKTEEPHHGKKAAVTISALAVLVVLLAGGGAYLYWFLNDKAENAVAQNNAATAAVAGLEAQVKELSESSATAKNESAAALQAKQELLTELSFLVAVPSLVPQSAASSSATSTAAQEVEVVVRGVLGNGTSVPYVLTTANGVKVAVKNNKDEKVVAVLKPLLGNPVELSGAHVLGSNLLTVHSVNGQPVQ